MAVPNRPSASRSSPCPAVAFLSTTASQLFGPLFLLPTVTSPVPFFAVDHQAPAQPDIPRVVPPYNPPPKTVDLFMSVSISSGSSINLLRRRRCIAANRGRRDVFLRAGQANTEAGRTVFFEPGRDSCADRP